MNFLKRKKKCGCCFWILQIYKIGGSRGLCGYGIGEDTGRYHRKGRWKYNTFLGYARFIPEHRQYLSCVKGIIY